ncbi:MAG: glucuronate isomerase [Ruminococcaceae bacterium]|nr:glucuronate isomerase [Oscillospiraceae bacterium]
MPHFLDENFLLRTPTAQRIYREYASELPIVDYHCHVSPREIYENRRFQSITELWLSGDHYKWRLMRENGVEERYITGDAPDFEKFYRFASLLPRAIGNPMYHWCHMELKTYFGYRGVLSADTAEEVYALCARVLGEGGLCARDIIEKSGVAFIGTTDDPVDPLVYHRLLAGEGTLKAVVAPTFRPDRALGIEKQGWRDYLVTLGDAADIAITDLDSLKQALSRRMAHFAAHGCRASDHGLDRACYREASQAELCGIMRRALAGEAVTREEEEAFKTELLLFCAAEYARLGFVMQLHYNCIRDPNSAMLRALGPDTGFDCIGPANGSRALASLLDRLYREGCLPRTVLYSLDPADNAFLDSLIGAFCGAGVRGSVQHGSAWWFNDHKEGIRAQLKSLASLGILGNFIGMLTDSRSFLSYTRHDYFRRILCDLIGEWVEGGEYPDDPMALEALVKDICFGNACRYFGLESEVLT